MNNSRNLRPFSIYSTFHSNSFSLNAHFTPRVFTRVAVHSHSRIGHVRNSSLKEWCEYCDVCAFKCQIRTKNEVLIARKQDIFLSIFFDFVLCSWILWEETQKLFDYLFMWCYFIFYIKLNRIILLYKNTYSEIGEFLSKFVKICQK